MTDWLSPELIERLNLDSRDWTSDATVIALELVILFLVVGSPMIHYPFCK